MTIQSNMEKVKSIAGQIPHFTNASLMSVTVLPCVFLLAVSGVTSILIPSLLEMEASTGITVFLLLLGGCAGIGIGIFLRSMLSKIVTAHVDRINQSFEKCSISVSSQEIRGVLLTDSKENDISQMNSVMFSLLSSFKAYLSIPTTCKDVRFRFDQVSSVEIDTKSYGYLQFENCCTLTANGINYYLMCLNAEDAQKIKEAFYTFTKDGES